MSPDSGVHELPFRPQEVPARGIRPLVNGGPICWVDQGVYSIQFKEVQFDFNYVHSDHGDIWAEMEVLNFTVGYEGTILRARVNLIKGNTRRDAVRDLEARSKAVSGPQRFEYDWATMMETATYWVVERARQGDPAYMMKDAPEPETTDWLLEPLILGRKCTIWFGDGDTGKSYAALAAAASIQTGEPWIGYPPSVKVPVAYLDWEWDGWEHRKRLVSLVGDGTDILYVPCHGLSLVDQVDRLRQLFRKHQTGFIVVDSAAYACEGEPEKSDVTTQFFRALDSFGVGSLVLAHTTKNGTDEKPFGSQFWYASARLIWLLKKQQEENSNTFSVGFVNKKSNTGPKPPPLALQFTYGTDTMEITTTDWRAMPNVMEKMPLQKRIQYAVSREPKSFVEIADELDSPVESIRRIITRYEGMFVKMTRAADRVTVVGLRASE